MSTRPNLVRSIGAAIADEAIRHVAGKNVVEVESHRLLVAGVSLMHRSTLHDFARARELLEEALLRSPNTPETNAWLGKWYVLSVFNGWSANQDKDTQRALDCTARALDLSPDNAFALTIDGFAHNNLLRRLDIAEQRYDAAIEQNPSEALSRMLKGALHAFRDEGEVAVAQIRQARRLSPLDPFGYFFDTLSASAHLARGDYDASLDFADRSLRANDRHLSSYRTRIAALYFLGRADEARAAASALMGRQPDFTVDGYLRLHPSAGFGIGKRVAEALRASGVQ